MTLLLDEWHLRFRQQARWTEALRAHFIHPTGLRPRRILEVGCGTGAVTSALAWEAPEAKIAGVDIDLPRLQFARAHDSQSDYFAADGMRLPFASRSFDLVCCHYLLLWIPTPEAVLQEMARVARDGGWVIAFAEPDYTARIDYPPPLEEIGRAQTKALRRQGADPAIGRRLAGLLAGAGLSVKETGVLGAEINPAESDAEETELEWKVMRDDLGAEVSDAEWERFRTIDRAARKRRERVLFVPTFYAAGTRDVIHG
jgi:ubiquinone/menaquinone biosynthesis C-methylase UbiE